MYLLIGELIHPKSMQPDSKLIVRTRCFISLVNRALRNFLHENQLHLYFDLSASDLMLSQQPAALASSQHSTLSMVSAQKPPSRCNRVHTENGRPPALMASGHVKLQSLWTPFERIFQDDFTILNTGNL